MSNEPSPNGDAGSGIGQRTLSNATVAALWTAIPLAVLYVIGRTTYPEFCARFWWQIPAILAGVVGGVAFLAAFATVPEWLRTATSKRRAAVLILGLGLMVMLVAAIAFLQRNGQILVIRSIFLLVVSLLPGVLFFLFVATRKGSLFKEFLANMDRLGFFAPRVRPPDAPGEPYRLESEPDRRRRIEAYLEKFEALYGPLQPEKRLEALAPPNERPQLDDRRRPTEGVVDVLSSDAAIPVLLATVLIALGWLMLLPPWQPEEWTANSSVVALKPTLTPTTAAFLGAYFFSLQSLFRRYVRRDLRPSAYVAVVLRILLATIGVWIIERASPDAGGLQGNIGSQLVMLGFIVGVFPRVAWQVVAGSVKTKVPEEWLPSLQTKLPISDLDGLTVWHEARLEEEDIENVPNMATADLLELILNTRFPPERIVDWMDQALLYTELGAEGTAKRQALRDHGIRTATGLTIAYREALAGGTADAFEKMLPGGDYSPIRSLVEVLETYPNINLIRMWRGLNGPMDRSVNVVHWDVVESVLSQKGVEPPAEAVWLLRCIVAEGERRLLAKQAPPNAADSFNGNLKRFVELAIDEACKTTPPGWSDGRAIIAARRQLAALWPFYGHDGPNGVAGPNGAPENPAASTPPPPA